MAAPAWLDALRAEAGRLREASLASLIDADPGRADDFRADAGPLSLLFARQHLDRGALAALHGVAESTRLHEAMARLLDGAAVNASESRPALHSALRGSEGPGRGAAAQAALAREARARAEALAGQLEAAGVRDVVNIGIGGSDLGPRLVADALREHGDGRFRVHFLANVDPHAVERLLATLEPAATAAVLVSKSFGTEETLRNGARVRAWLGDDDRLLAVSANVDRAVAFGVAPERVLPMWDWVGGRFSLWSAVGFAARLAIGRQGFEALLAGAAAMDRHALEAPVASNAAMLHALLAVWNRNALGLPTTAVLPYDERLALLPAHLQQLVMESLGKSVSPAGIEVGAATSPVLWGGVGTSSQHSFFQALHQGSDPVSCEFIAVRQPDHGDAEGHRVLLAHLLAQSEALARGHDSEDPQRRHPGGRPSSLILLDRLDPRALGALVALYEHSVYLQGVLWGINPFDQWGVELGKRLAGQLLPRLAGEPGEAGDAVTAALLRELGDAG